MAAVYENLVAWQKSMELVTHIYKLIDKMPNSEKYALVDQMRRSAISVPSNIAEGQGRGSDKDTAHFLYIARGSLYELQTQIELCNRLGYVANNDIIEIKDLATEIAKMLNSLIGKKQ